MCEPNWGGGGKGPEEGEIAEGLGLGGSRWTATGGEGGGGGGGGGSLGACKGEGCKEGPRSEPFITDPAVCTAPQEEISNISNPKSHWFKSNTLSNPSSSAEKSTWKILLASAIQTFVKRRTSETECDKHKPSWVWTNVNEESTLFVTLGSTEWCDKKGGQNIWNQNFWGEKMEKYRGRNGVASSCNSIWRRRRRRRKRKLNRSHKMSRRQQHGRRRLGSQLLHLLFEPLQLAHQVRHPSNCCCCFTFLLQFFTQRLAWTPLKPHWILTLTAIFIKLNAYATPRNTQTKTGTNSNTKP